ncbi:MAG: hypothetical protein JXA21_29485 [Anaerolineae bacterium]|nr:hypothetical protein [Anaerolineae bacterium]
MKPKERSLPIITLFAWAIALGGYFGPWIGHPSAALAWNAYDLFDMLRPLPEIETGALTVNLFTLRLPLVGLALILPLILAKARWGWRAAGALMGIALAIATFPPYPYIVTAWRTPGWNVPFWWGVATMIGAPVLAFLAPALHKARRWATPAWLAFTLIPGIVTFNRIRPALQTLHAAPIRAGWGVWLCSGGFMLVAILALSKRPAKRGEAKMDSELAQARAIKKKYEHTLLKKANVVSIGIGSYTREGESFQEIALIVGVTRKVPPGQLAPKDRIPKTLDGVRVQVQVVGEIQIYDRQEN